MKNIYNNKIARITYSKTINNLMVLRLTSGDEKFMPGQFYMLGIPGFGEAPFTPTNYPEKRNIYFLIRKVGSLTNKIFNLKENDKLTIRGPFGNHFPFKNMIGKNIILVAGGCGIAPIKSALEYCYRNYYDYKSIKLFYGTNSPNEIIFKKRLNQLKDRIEILYTVARTDNKYHGNIGFVDKLIDDKTVETNSCAILCGPPQMYDSVIKKLLCLELEAKDIYLQLERRMHCGTGHCQHCSCGDKLVCKDGPVFSYKELLNMNTKI